MKTVISVAGNRLSFQGKTYRCAIGRGGFSADKKEGDGCTPLGVFPLRECWYRADRMAAPKTGLLLRVIQKNEGWCDDPKSPNYNKHVKIRVPLSNSPSPFRGEGWGGGEEPLLLRFAKKLRANMTEAEKALWYHLRAHRFASYGFRRQCPMGKRYIVDFICPKKKLIIEIDGGQHADSAKDHVRDQFLRDQGYRVLRFWNHDVLVNTEGVLSTILDVLHNADVSVQTPSLTLPPEGGGDIMSLPATPLQGESYSFEPLWLSDHTYDLIIPIGYNDDPVIPGKGSAIFLHVAKPDYAPTEGCVALKKEDLLEVLTQLDTASRIDIRGK